MEPDAAPDHPRWRQPAVGVAAALAALVVAVVVVVVMGAGDADVATESATSTPDEPTTTDAPEVLGERVERDPATTIADCSGSTDPACGPFRWEPAPVNRPGSLTIHAPTTIVAGAPVPLRLEMTDPDGPVTLSCYAVNLDRPGLATGTCAAEQVTCPDRHGPWPPPPASPGQGSTDVEVRFDEPGTYVVTADVSPPDGCDHVDPYRSGATATLTVEVQPAA